MGRDKALLEVAPGQSLAMRAAVAVGKVCSVVTLVGDPAVYSGLGLPVIADRFAGQGPLAGIEAALGATDADWNLVVACDMPSLDPVVLEALFAAGGDCAMPKYEDGRVEPLCAAYHRRCHGAVLRALEAGVRKVTDGLRMLELRYVRVQSAAPFANLNTPEDVRKYRHG